MKIKIDTWGCGSDPVITRGTKSGGQLLLLLLLLRRPPLPPPPPLLLLLLLLFLFLLLLIPLRTIFLFDATRQEYSSQPKVFVLHPQRPTPLFLLLLLLLLTPAAPAAPAAAASGSSTSKVKLPLLLLIFFFFFFYPLLLLITSFDPACLLSCEITKMSTLDKERSGASFPVRQMTYFLDGRYL